MTTVAADTETRGLDFWDPDHRAFLGTWADESGSYAAWEDDAEAVGRFLGALREADRIVFHNASFDVHHIRERWGFDCLRDTDAQIVDTDILARVVVPERRTAGDDANDRSTHGFKLKGLAKAYLSQDSGDAESLIEELAKSSGIKLKATGGYYDVGRAHPEAMEHYAKVDTELTRDLLTVLESKITDRNRPCWDLERTIQPTLIRAEQRGVRVDQEKVVPLHEEYTRRATEQREVVAKALGEEALEGNDALKEALLAHGVPLHRKTPTGELATNRFALAEFANQFPVLDTFLELRTSEKFLSTYIGPMLGRETVHCSVWQIGAWSGRMSTSRPSMQNIPVRAGSEVREMFVPREGHSFVVCDFDSIELRLLAYYLHSSEFQQLIADGADIFAMLAAEVYGPGGPQQEHGYGPDPDSYRKGTDGEKLRSNAKNVTYAVTYGAGAPRIADMLGIERDEAKRVINKVKSWLPGYWDLAGPRGRIRKKVEHSGFVTTLFGRKQPIKRDKAYVGLSGLIQGGAADIFKQAVINIEEAVNHLDAQSILYVHDEAIVECPTEYADECLTLVEQAMEAAYDLTPPLAVSGKVCHTDWAEAK